MISPVKSILYEGFEIIIPTKDTVGPFAQRLWRTLMDIQYGKVLHPWSIVV